MFKYSNLPAGRLVTKLPKQFENFKIVLDISKFEYS